MRRRDDAAALVARVEAERPEMVRLARLLSLAARVEPELVRRLRLAFFPRSHAGLEADLWLGPFVRAHDPFGLVFREDVLDVLRRQLAATREVMDRAWAEIEDAHRELAPVLQLEERVTYHALRGDRDAMQRWLGAAVAALEDDRRGGVARWAVRTLPALPSRAASSEAGRVLAAEARARVDAGDDGPAAASIDAARVRAASRRAIGVRRFAGALELSEPPAAGAETMEVPDFLGLDGDRLEVEVETPTAGGWEGTVVSWLNGTTTRVPVADGPVRVRDALGDGVTVAAPPPPPRSASASSTSDVAERLVEELRELGVPEPDDVALVIDADRAGPSPRRTLGDVVDARNRGTATVLLAAPPRGEPVTAPDDEEREREEGPEIVRLVDELIATAILLRARGLAIEPRGPDLDADVTVRFDDGEEWTFVRIAARAIPAVVTRVKILADLDIAERRVEQTGRLRWSAHPAARIAATTKPPPRRKEKDAREGVTLRIESTGLGDDHHVVRLPAGGAGEEETARRLRTLAIEIERRRFAAWAKEVRAPGNERFPDFSAELARHPELLGRNALLDHLAGWVDSDDLPAPRSMAIVGRVGVGKTALIAHAVGRWREAGHPVALHVVDRWGRETLDDVLRSLARQVERHAGLWSPRGLDARGQLSAALARALGRVVEDRWTGEWNPLVVCVDGIDAIAGVDLGALDAVLRVPKGDALRLVWTVRAESEVASSYAPDRDRHVVDLDDPEWRGPADEAMRVWLERGDAGGATA